MISMLSQLSSTQDARTPLRDEPPLAPKMGTMTTLAVLGMAILFSLFVVTGVHGIAQAFGIA